MQLLSILTTTLLGSVALISAATSGYQWKCDMAQDGSGLLQEPTCCNQTSRRNSNQEAVLGSDCFNVPLTQNKLCPGRKPLMCCYSMDPEYVCTSFPKWENPDDE